MASFLNASKESKSKEKLHKLISHFRQKLDLIGCPYTADVDDGWMVELLFHTGEQRVRLLQWLFNKYDHQLNDALDPHFAPPNIKMDSRIQRLLHVASCLGLCKEADDVDIIRGAASISKQTAFLNQLIDMVYIAVEADNSDNLTGISSTDQFAWDCTFGDQLASSQRLDEVLSTRAKVLAPDVQRQIKLSSGGRQAEEEKSQALSVDFNQLKELAEQCEKNLLAQKELLEEIKTTHKLSDRDPQHVNRMARVVLSELSQTLRSFSCCYENDLLHWCHHPEPFQSELGPTTKRIHSLLRQFSSLLDGLGTAHSSQTNIMTRLREDLDKVTKICENGRHDERVGSSTRLKHTQDYVTILEESLSRRDLERDSHNSTLSSVISASIINVE